MSVRYPGYFEAVARREENRQQIYLQVFSQLVGAGRTLDAAETHAAIAVRLFDKQFPEPKWPGPDDLEDD